MAAYEQLVSVSGTATNGQIPQANGSGGYTWVTPAPVVKVNCGTFSSLPITVNSSMITADMELIHAEIGSINAQTGDWTVTTANGSVTVSGTITDSTTLVLYLCVPVIAS